MYESFETSKGQHKISEEEENDEAEIDNYEEEHE